MNMRGTEVLQDTGNPDVIAEALGAEPATQATEAEGDEA